MSLKNSTPLTAKKPTGTGPYHGLGGGELLLAMAFGGITMAISGLVLSHLWYLFIAPAFGLPLLTIPQAVGIALVVQYLTIQDVSDRTDGMTFRQHLAYHANRILTKNAAFLILATVVSFFL